MLAHKNDSLYVKISTRTQMFKCLDENKLKCRFFENVVILRLFLVKLYLKILILSVKSRNAKV